MDPNLRNLRDFLTLYNKVTELCFSRCVDNFNERDLAKHEEACVSRCVNKFALFNQSMMKVYVEVQSEINQKRMQELEEGQKLIQQNQQQQQQSTSTADIAAALTPTPKLFVTMDQICIVGLIGLPAVGKTTFSKLFLEIETLPFNILHICYDHFLNSTEAAVPYKVQRECLLTNVASTVESLKKSKIFCNNLNLQSCSRYKDYGHDRVMIICDDNNYYSSMRFKLYQIARKFSISYGQIYFECNAELALRRNSLRFANKVPEEVFHKMSLDLEIPQLAQHYWEINTLNMHTDNINRQFILSDIVPFLTQLFDCPVKPLESEMTKCLTKQSRVHDLDLLMRKRIGLLMNSKVYLNKNEMAKLLNDKRKDILKKFQDMEIHEETDIDGVFRLFEKNLESIYNTQVSDV